jgi:hypothetical protein
MKPVCAIVHRIPHRLGNIALTRGQCGRGKGLQYRPGKIGVLTGQQIAHRHDGIGPEPRGRRIARLDQLYRNAEMAQFMRQ